MGNVRLSYFKNAGGSAEVLEENNFYPFGLKHEGYNQTAGNPSYSYQYNGKELQKETGLSDYGARMYMADIGRWGVIDPLAETSRRFTPYNYAYDNPISFIDPDGRKAMAPNSYESLQPMNGALGYILGGGREFFGSFADFLGQGNPFSQLGNKSAKGSGGSGTTIGNIMRSVGITLGSLESFMQMNTILSLREQLMEAGFDKPEETIAKYSDKDKLLTEVPSLNELLKITKAGFKEDFNIKSPGLTRGQVVLININRIKNVLSYAFTLGHEMYGHVFANLFFKDKFSEVTRIPKASPRAFDFFQEIMGLSWEISMGSTRYGDKSGSAAAKTFYGPDGLGYPQPIIDRVNEHLPSLMYEWRIMYNIKKNQLK